MPARAQVASQWCSALVLASRYTLSNNDSIHQSMLTHSNRNSTSCRAYRCHSSCIANRGVNVLQAFACYSLLRQQARRTLCSCVVKVTSLCQALACVVALTISCVSRVCRSYMLLCLNVRLEPTGLHSSAVPHSINKKCFAVALPRHAKFS